MRYFSLDVYQYKKLSEECQNAIIKVNEGINQCIQVGNYLGALDILEKAAIEFQMLGIYSSIYYRISSMKNRVFDIGKNTKEVRSKQMLFDVYHECCEQKDYRNAIRMLHYYESAGEDQLKVVPLHLAKVYMKLGDLEKAKRYLSECRDVQFDNPMYTFVLLEILYKEKKYEDVVNLLPELEHYDGRTTWTIYVLVAKACLVLGKEKQAQELYDIAIDISHKRETILKKIEESRISIIHEQKRIYPTRANLAMLFQIACDEENVADAESYLKQLLGKVKTEKILEVDQEKIKKLGELKERCKGVESN